MEITSDDRLAVVQIVGFLNLAEFHTGVIHFAKIAKGFRGDESGSSDVVQAFFAAVNVGIVGLLGDCGVLVQAAKCGRQFYHGGASIFESLLMVEDGLITCGVVNIRVQIVGKRFTLFESDMHLMV